MSDYLIDLIVKEKTGGKKGMFTPKIDSYRNLSVKKAIKVMVFKYDGRNNKKTFRVDKMSLKEKVKEVNKKANKAWQEGSEAVEELLGIKHKK